MSHEPLAHVRARMVFDRVLTDDEVRALERYYAGRYDIALYDPAPAVVDRAVMPGDLIER